MTSRSEQALFLAELRVALHFAPIRLAIAAADAPAHSMTLADFASTSSIAQEYRRAAQQILAFLEGERCADN